MNDIKKINRLKDGYKYMHDVIIPTCKISSVSSGDIKNMSVCLSNFSIYKCSCCGNIQIASTYRCKNRFCVMCQHIKTSIWIKKIMPFLLEWQAKGNYICMLNFTLKDMDNLKDMINAINKAFRILYHEDKNNREWFKKRFVGGLRSLEVVIGENSNKWHCHLHCIVLQDSFKKDYEELSYRWNRSCCQALNINLDSKIGSVYISEITNNLFESLLEVIKYILKPNLSLYQNFDCFKEAYFTLKGRRQVNTWRFIAFF